MRRLLVGFALLLSFISAVNADEFKPAYLQLKQTSVDTFDVLWKAPAQDEYTTIKVKPVFPDDTTKVSDVRSFYSNGTMVQRWQIESKGGMQGKIIRFPEMPDSNLDILVRLERLDGSEQLQRILPTQPSFEIKSSPGSLEVVKTYTVIGFEHILLGFDHLLFVLALVMIVKTIRLLFFTVTAFTVAHSITLSLATLGVIHVSGPPVEAVIALSIVFVASEILHRRQGRESLATRKPWIVAFAFGLLHGLGFAGALAEVGLPSNAIPLALLFFNIGVELGQITFIIAVLAIYKLLTKIVGLRYDLSKFEPLPVYLIGGIASYWVFERIAGFWV